MGDPANMKYRVLLVEDDESVGPVLLEVLLKADYDVTLADGFSSIKRLKHFDYSAVVSDFRLMDGDACDVIEFMREKIPGVPAIVMSGMGAQVAFDFETRRIEGVTLLNKPFRPQKLLEILKTSLEPKKLCP